MYNLFDIHPVTSFLGKIGDHHYPYLVSSIFGTTVKGDFEEPQHPFGIKPTKKDFLEATEFLWQIIEFCKKNYFKSEKSSKSYSYIYKHSWFNALKTLIELTTQTLKRKNGVTTVNPEFIIKILSHYVQNYTELFLFGFHRTYDEPLTEMLRYFFIHLFTRSKEIPDEWYLTVALADNIKLFEELVPDDPKVAEILKRLLCTQAKNLTNQSGEKIANPEFSKFFKCNSSHQGNIVQKWAQALVMQMARCGDFDTSIDIAPSEKTEV